MSGEYRKFVSVLYVFNIVAQGLFTFVTPVGIGILLSWLITSKLGAPTWIYVPFIIVGFIFGFVSMIRFILIAMRQLDHLERQHRESGKKD